MEEEKKSAVTPLSLLNAKNYGPKELGEARYAICQECPELIKVTKQCRRCGCFMVAKTKLANATCPLGKWQLWYNKTMTAQPHETPGGTFTIPKDTDPANIVTAFMEFSDSISTMMDSENNTRFSGLLQIYNNPSGRIVGTENTNGLVVFDNAGAFSIDDLLPIGWNCAVVHLDSTVDLVPPTMPVGQNINWAGDLPPFVIASIVKVSDTQFVSTFGSV